MADESDFSRLVFIEEVKKRPALYQCDTPVDRGEKLKLWKEVGAVVYRDEWDAFDKATAYDRVLTLQKKWRSLRDAYNRELRVRRTGVRINKRVYVYFKHMNFLGGCDGESFNDIEGEDVQTADESADANAILLHINKRETKDPLQCSGDTVISKRKKKSKKRKIKKYDTNTLPLEEDNETYSIDVHDCSSAADSDRLFLLSFLPELRQLPLNIKMWARAQIANIMQEAVTRHFNTTDNTKLEAIKNKAYDSESE